MTQTDRPGWNSRYLSWFSFIMVGAYITLGIVILSGGYFKTTMESKYRIALGTLTISYGIFRAWRAWQDHVRKVSGKD